METICSCTKVRGKYLAFKIFLSQIDFDLYQLMREVVGFDLYQLMRGVVVFMTEHTNK